jgi:hypothetical protein
LLGGSLAPEDDIQQQNELKFHEMEAELTSKIDTLTKQLQASEAERKTLKTKSDMNRPPDAEIKAKVREMLR